MDTKRQLSLIIFGPAIAGAALGLRSGLPAAADHALRLPVILAGVATLMVPALYIGAALFGVAPRGQLVVSGARSALSSSGGVLLGLAPSLAFLAASAEDGRTISVLLGVAAVGAAALLGLRTLFRELFTEPSAAQSPGAPLEPALVVSRRRSIPLFVAWSLVSLGIGARLVWSALAG